MGLSKVIVKRFYDKLIKKKIQELIWILKSDFDYMILRS